MLIPCLNEEKGIASVVSEYRRAFPEARILVIDNGSTDGTASAARAAGEEVIREARRGKARAVATALNLIDEDLVLMVDGDGTYPAEGARLLFPLCEQGMDLVTGLRTPRGGEGAVFRRFHRGGSALFHAAMRFVFGYAPGGLASALRLFSRRFSRTCPSCSAASSSRRSSRFRPSKRASVSPRRPYPSGSGRREPRRSTDSARRDPDPVFDPRAFPRLSSLRVLWARFGALFHGRTRRGIPAHARVPPDSPHRTLSARDSRRGPDEPGALLNPHGRDAGIGDPPPSGGMAESLRNFRG